MSRAGETYSAIGVAGGQRGETDDQVVLVFDGPAGPLEVALPAAELMALLSVCVGLAGQALPQGGEADHPTIPVADWRVGVTADAAVLGLAPEPGGALAFHLTPQQAGQIAAALGRAAALAQSAEAPAQGGH
ncbi:hypothetical protein LJR219_001197 [Phenylobacterium sp. LjRoot219]|uniref:hypothetical protein n=1 Tax=Phenylobacterium sp. LjRoot219 TaxID=3342283 RepID=UPI003ECD0C95